MRFTNASEIHDFMNTVEKCEGTVWLESPTGDKLVLNSMFSRYVAMSALLADRGEELELFCQLAEDRSKFYKYFGKYPDSN